MPYLESRSGTNSVDVLVAIVGDSVVTAWILGCFFSEGVASSVNFAFICVEIFVLFGCSNFSLLTSVPDNETVTTNRINTVIALLSANILLLCLLRSEHSLKRNLPFVFFSLSLDEMFKRQWISAANKNYLTSEKLRINKDGNELIYSQYSFAVDCIRLAFQCASSNTIGSFNLNYSAFNLLPLFA